MQRLYNIKKWTHVKAGGAMNFAEERERKIRLDVNSAGQAALFYVDGDGEATLLGLVNGRDVLEFQTHGGAFSIAIEDADCWVFTIDGEDVSFQLPEAVTFTRLVERRQRNPEVEMMQYMMNRNTQILLESQRDELEQLFNRREAAARVAAEKPAAASDGGADREESKPSNHGGKSGKPEQTDGGDGAKASK